MTREDFEIAIICALPLEADAVNYLFDEFWDLDGDSFQKTPRDQNHYTTGRIGKFNVVLVHLPGMGKANAATAATFLLSSYTNVRLALVVGICGGVPVLDPDDERDEVLLGDVVISNAVVQYDFRRNSTSEPTRTHNMRLEDVFNKAGKDIAALLKSLSTYHGKARIRDKTARHLKELQNARATAVKRDGETLSKTYQYPGTSNDRLFKSSHLHRHRSSLPRAEPRCGCTDKSSCDQALRFFCENLGCLNSPASLVQPRKRLNFKRVLERDPRRQSEAQVPCVHIGTVGSGDIVMRSAVDRDRLAQHHNIIALEMEGAGVWETMPCIIIKGVSDYADSHKDKKWQNFAAATAASATKALLEVLIRRDSPGNFQRASSWPTAKSCAPSSSFGHDHTGPTMWQHVPLPRSESPATISSFSTDGPEPEEIDNGMKAYTRELIALCGGLQVPAAENLANDHSRALARIASLEMRLASSEEAVTIAEQKAQQAIANPIAKRNEDILRRLTEVIQRRGLKCRIDKDADPTDQVFKILDDIFENALANFAFANKLRDKCDALSTELKEVKAKLQ